MAEEFNLVDWRASLGIHGGLIGEELYCWGEFPGDWGEKPTADSSDPMVNCKLSLFQRTTRPHSTTILLFRWLPVLMFRCGFTQLVRPSPWLPVLLFRCGFTQPAGPSPWPSACGFTQLAGPSPWLPVLLFRCGFTQPAGPSPWPSARVQFEWLMCQCRACENRCLLFRRL
jgi:hypothetical protein